MSAQRIKVPAKQSYESFLSQAPQKGCLMAVHFLH